MSVLSRNHFELFGLPVRFETDLAALDAAYRGVQGAVHPDRHAGGTAADRRVAMQLATHANEAYRTLRDPARRGAYLCALAGVDVEFESNTAMPAQFLMQQIEWREALDDARAARSAAGLQALRDVSRRRATPCSRGWRAPSTPTATTSRRPATCAR